MYVHDATEYAYKHGYEKGYEVGKRDFTREKWISIKKKLPTKSDADEDGNVLAITKDLMAKDLKKIIINWEDVCRFSEYITHWMHIPYCPES